MDPSKEDCGLLAYRTTCISFSDHCRRVTGESVQCSAAYSTKMRQPIIAPVCDTCVTSHFLAPFAVQSLLLTCAASLLLFEARRRGAFHSNAPDAHAYRLITLINHLNLVWLSYSFFAHTNPIHSFNPTSDTSQRHRQRQLLPATCNCSRNAAQQSHPQNDNFAFHAHVRCRRHDRGRHPHQM
jgi:hypothetical protein